MKQSRAMSFVESTANVVVGYGVAVATQILGTSGQIKEHTGTIEATMVGRVAGNGHA